MPAAFAATFIGAGAGAGFAAGTNFNATFAGSTDLTAVFAALVALTGAVAFNALVDLTAAFAEGDLETGFGAGAATFFLGLETALAAGFMILRAGAFLAGFGGDFLATVLIIFFAGLAAVFLVAVFFVGLETGFALPLAGLAGLAAGFFTGFFAGAADFLAAGFRAAGLMTFFAAFLMTTRRILSFPETQKAACYSLVLGKRQHYPHTHGRANA